MQSRQPSRHCIGSQTSRLMFYGLLLWQPLALAANAPALSTPRPTPGWQAVPTSISDGSGRCTDPTIDSRELKDPKNFAKVMELFSRQDPQPYARVAGLAMEPATARNHMEWSDPTIYAKWMQGTGTSLNPWARWLSSLMGQAPPR